MSWLHFKKKGTEIELEAPPAPPMIDAQDIPGMPSFPEEVREKKQQFGKKTKQQKAEELPSFSKELPPFPGEELPYFSGEETELPAFEKELPSLQMLPMQEQLKPLSAVLPQYIKIPELVLKGRTLEREAAEEERKAVHSREKIIVEKPIFVEGMDFRKMIGGLNDLHAELVECEAHLAHWIQNDETKLAHLDNFKTAIEQMQRKLIYIDKTLFE